MIKVYKIILVEKTIFSPFSMILSMWKLNLMSSLTYLLSFVCRVVLYNNLWIKGGKLNATYIEPYPSVFPVADTSCPTMRLLILEAEDFGSSTSFSNSWHPILSTCHVAWEKRQVQMLYIYNLFV